MNFKLQKLTDQLITHNLIKLFGIVLVLFSLLASSSSYAVVSDITMVLIPGKSGVAPFDADDLPGHDSSADNNIVRTNDRFDYRVSYNALDTNQVNFVFTAPVGVYWLNSGANTTVCNGTGGPVISGGGRILTCPRKPASVQVESFDLPAIAGNIANATEFTIGITAGAATGTSQIVKISAIPRTEMYVQGSSYNKVTVGGAYGASYGLALRVGMSNLTTGSSVGTVKGLESAKTPFTITLSVLPPGTVVTSCPGTCSQPGGPGTPVFITLSNQSNSLSNSGGTTGNSGVISNFRELSYNGISFFTPFGSNFPAGAKTPLNMQFTDFAPESLSGVSNYLGSTATGYAANYAPGYAPGFNSCPDGHSCIRLTIDRTIRTELYTHFHGTYYTPTGDLIFGDSEASTNNPGNGAESVMPGHYFTFMYPVSNSTAAEDPAHNLGSCVVWDPAKMELQSRAKLKIGSGGEFFRVGSTSWPDVTAVNHILEYSAQSYATDTARRNAACGVAGDGDVNWFSDPTAVPGGISAVSSARYKYLPDMVPGATVGFMASFRRPLTTYSLEAPYMTLSPWFMQYWADEKARSFPSPYGGSGLSGYGGRVNYVNALFRHKITASTNSVAPGGIITMTVTPIAIGSSITGVDATVKNAKVKVTMPDTCLEPVPASLPSFAILTPPNYGADGIPCSGDAGETAANVVFSLGDYAAPGGTITTPGGYQGRATSYPTFSFNILAAFSSPVKTVSWTSVDSADNDPTPVYHSTSGSVAIAGVAGFSVVKSTSGTTNGKIGPNETFNYIINFGNGGSVGSGKGRFVDVLPFDGDSRGTVGLGTGKMVITGLSAGMTSPSQGTVGIEYTTDAALSVEAAIKIAGNEDGQTGVNWTSYTAGASIPSNATAVRFTTSGLLNPGYSGFGSIQVKGPTIKSTTNTFNNVWGRTEALAGDTSTVKIMNGVSTLKVQGIDGASLRGKVHWDINDNGNQEVSEAGIASSLVTITCTAGACLTAPQGSVFSMLTEASGGYGFEPNLANKVFANTTATGSPLAIFDGTVAGTWTISIVPPNTQPFINVSRSLGTINSVPSGVGSGRSITGVAMVGNGIGINYNFGERLAHGKITVTKAPLTLPTGVSGPFSFTFEATCDLPVANTKYNATLANFPTTTSVDIVNIPANSTCTVAEVLPSLPAGFAWGAPVISALSPAGTMPAGGTQNITVTNQIFDGFYITKSVAQAPVQVAGELTQYDVTYQIDVINRTTSVQNYNLSDSFLFDPDLSIVGTPIVSKLGSNITQAINSSFTGSGTQTSIILEENIAAAVGTTPEIESYTVKLRFNINTFNTSNNTCNGSNANGLLNQATLSFGSSNVNAQACSNTPSGAPVFLKLKVKWVGGKATDKVTVAATTGFTSGNIALFESINSGAGNYTESSEAIVGPTQTGVLAQPVFATSDQEKNYQMSSYSCTDGVNTPIEVVANASLTIPSASAGKSLMCTITLTFIDFSTAKTAQPVTGTSVSVGDEIIYTLKTTVTGASSLKPLLITDSLDAGLTVVDKPSNCVLTGQTMVCTLAAGASVGEHSISYKTKVNENATKNKVAGVKNSITVDAGSCNPCSTEHGMWSVDTSKSSDAKGKKGIEVGQTITYTLTVKVQGGKTTQDVILKDTRSVGLAVASVPQGCQQKGLVITCVLASGSAAGEYKFVYTAEVTDDAGDFVSNKVVPNKGTCLTVCQTSIKVLREVMLRITKTTNSKVVKIGDFVRYELLVENLTGPNAKKFYIVDQAAPGLNYVEGSLKVVGDNEWKLSSNYPLKIEQLELDKGEKLVISYLMRVGAGAGRGSLKNTAWADDVRKYVSSNKATASVTRGLDPDFEATRIFGRVFEDSNENGIQDANEAGLAGVRLITTSGLIIETDSYGRYHLDDLDPGVSARGGQFIISLDESSLAKGAYLTTENPQIKRITPALPVQFNFGVAFPK